MQRYAVVFAKYVLNNSMNVHLDAATVNDLRQQHFIERLETGILGF